MIQVITAITLISIFLVGCSTGVAPKSEIAEINNLAIITTLGREFRFGEEGNWSSKIWNTAKFAYPINTSVGTSLERSFSNSGFDVDLKNDLSYQISYRLSIIQGGYVPDFKKLLKTIKERGYDGILIVSQSSIPQEYRGRALYGVGYIDNRPQSDQYDAAVYIAYNAIIVTATGNLLFEDTGYLEEVFELDRFPITDEDLDHEISSEIMGRIDMLAKRLAAGIAQKIIPLKRTEQTH